MKLLTTTIVVAAMLAVIAVQPAQSASQTTAQALSSLDWLIGHWSCAGGGKTWKDTYTRNGVWIVDTGSDGGMTLITFDAKRQKLVVLYGGQDGYGVSEATGSSSDRNTMTFYDVYPKAGQQQYVVRNTPDHSHLSIGGQKCTKM